MSPWKTFGVGFLVFFLGLLLTGFPVPEALALFVIFVGLALMIAAVFIGLRSRRPKPQPQLAPTDPPVAPIYPATPQAQGALIQPPAVSYFVLPQQPSYNPPPPPNPPVTVNVQQAAATPPPPEIMRRCRYCEAVYPENLAKCPRCGAGF